MKHIVSILLVLTFLGCMIPGTVQATTFPLEDTDLTVQIDDSLWYVFTPDNILGNPELDELGISHSDIRAFFETQGVILDAILIYEDGRPLELAIAREYVAEVANLTNYSQSELDTYASGIELTLEGELGFAPQMDTLTDDYKYVVIEYAQDASYSKHYLTVVNHYVYTFSFSGDFPFTDEDYAWMDTIMDGVFFEVDQSMKEAKDSTGGSFRPSVIRGLIVCAVGIIGTIVRDKKKDKNKKEPEV